MATTATSFPTSLSSEALLPVLTAQLGSELLAKQVIKTLEEAAEKEARKKLLQQATTTSSIPLSDSPMIVSSVTSPNQNNQNNNNYNNNYHHHQHHYNTILKTTNQKSAFLPVTSSTTTSSTQIIRPIPKPISPIFSTSFIPSSEASCRGGAAAAPIPSSPSVLSASNILNVPSRAFSRPSTPTSSRRSSSFRQPSPSTSACSIKSTSSTINSSSDKPFAVNTRGRKRVYTDEERRLRKNNSSKKSREKHTEQVMEKKVKLEQLQDKHHELIEKRLQLDKEIQEHRQHLCPYCLNVVEEALREIGKGQDIVVLKRVNFCCSTYHAQQSHQSSHEHDDDDELHHHHHQHQPSCPLTDSGNDNDVIIDRVVKHEPSEFS